MLCDRDWLYLCEPLVSTTISLVWIFHHRKSVNMAPPRSSQTHKRKLSLDDPTSTPPTDDDPSPSLSPKPSPKKRVSFADSSQESQGASASPDAPSPGPKKKQKRSFQEYSSQPIVSTAERQDRLPPGPASQPTLPSDDETRIFDTSFVQLVDKLWRAIIPRIAEIAADQRYCRKVFHPIFKPNEMAPASRKTVRRLLKHPMEVSTSNLSQFLELRHCTEDTPPQVGVANVYYIRTFALTKSQLTEIIATWELSGRFYDTAANWARYIASAKVSDEKTLYVRYIGMAKGGRTAWDRFSEDITGRKSGILGAFLEAVANRFPTVLDISDCHEILSASFSSVIKPVKALVDDRERILIALFDRNVLLNQQGGGFYPAYTPRSSDHQIYMKLQPSFFRQYATKVDTHLASRIQMRANIGVWIQKLSEYALQHPIETLSNKFPLTESYLSQVVSRQAIPALIKGRALLTLVGKDVTIEDIQGENTFLSGSSRAGKITVDMLTRLHQWEFGFAQQLLQPFVDGQFPFVDVFPWIGKSEPEHDVGLVREYLGITQPRIVVTFSRLVASWTASNFVHAHGLPRYVALPNSLI